jgi:hypothetical protein
MLVLIPRPEARPGVVDLGCSSNRRRTSPLGSTTATTLGRDYRAGPGASRSAVDTGFVFHETRVVKNVTVTLDEETARWARIEAARLEMSVSSFIRNLLRERMGGQAAYAGAMNRYLSRPGLDLSGGRSYPSRDELHDRAGLR